MRATTRTTLNLGDLLQIPVGVCTATSDSEIKLDNALPDGTKRQQVYVDPRLTRDPRDLLADDDAEHFRDGEMLYTKADASVKGVRAGDQFFPVPDAAVEDALADLPLEAVEALEFIDYRRVPTDRLMGSYWLQPDPGFARPMRVLMDAMRAEGRAMVVRFMLRYRERLGVIRVRQVRGGHALLLNTVHYAAQWRDADDQVLAASQADAPDERAVTAARGIIASMAGDGAVLESATDSQQEAMARLVEAATNGDYDPTTLRERAGARDRSAADTSGDDARALRAEAEHLRALADRYAPPAPAEAPAETVAA